MKWSGETYKQYIERSSSTWNKAYALFPVQMYNGTWVWLAYYETRLNSKYKRYSSWSKREIGDTNNLHFDRTRPPPPPPADMTPELDIISEDMFNIKE